MVCELYLNMAIFLKNKNLQGLPWWSSGWNSSANAGRSHITLEQLSPSAITTEPLHLELCSVLGE